MAMMNSVHMWFRPLRDELSLTCNDDSARPLEKGVFRRIFGETHRDRR